MNVLVGQYSWADGWTCAFFSCNCRCLQCRISDLAWRGLRSFQGGSSQDASLRLAVVSDYFYTLVPSRPSVLGMSIVLQHNELLYLFYIDGILPYCNTRSHTQLFSP